MPRKAKPRIVRPSGIETSANGKYFYWRCNISQLQTFADEKRFKEVVAKFGGEEKLFKTYVLRPVQKYVDAGFSVESIKDIAERNNGKLPSLNAAAKARKASMPKQPRKKRLKQFAVGEIGVLQTNESGSVEEIKQKVYPWTGNPGYFLTGEAGVIDVAEVTKDSCLYPSTYLDNLCEGCPVFALCVCPLKVNDEDRHSSKLRRVVPKIRVLNVYEDEL